jgi:glycosyltransferase involved in cell wall biosynthesis
VTSPLVTFIVPCYNLAHYLVECVDSILAQSFADFEVLIMDDCSPDDTPQVAASITDRRVRHVRHEANVGHLRNYNIGIELAKGKYIWVISADDRLRGNQILERYTTVLEGDDDVAFAFCTGLTMSSGGIEGTVTGLTYPADRIVSSDDFMARAIRDNPVCTPGALARRQHYVDNGLFPLDLPFAGDWFTWCAFGLRGKVAFFAEPMVNYRLHDGSNTAIYRRERAALIIHDEIDVRWRILRMATQSGRTRVAAACRDAIARDYVERLMHGRRRSTFGMSMEEFDQSTASKTDASRDIIPIRSRVFELLGDECQDRGDLIEARHLYGLAQRAKSRLGLGFKRVLGQLGGPGLLARNTLSDWKGAPAVGGRSRRNSAAALTTIGSPAAGASHHSPVVSVVIPCYNGAAFLKDALDSVLNQTYQSIEIIVVNDGSTDDFADVIAPYRSRVTVIDQLNIGLSAARNRGLDHCSGDLIAYLDADDQWHPSKLQQQVAVMLERPNLSFVHTAVQFTDEDGVPITTAKTPQPAASGDCLAELARWNSVIISSVLHPRRPGHQQRFDPHITSAGDWDLWLRLAATGPVAYIEQPLTLYRYHANNMSRHRRLIAMDGLKVLARALQRTADRTVRRALFSARAERYSQLAHLAYEADNLDAARMLFWGCLSQLDGLGLARLGMSSIGLSRARVTSLMGRMNRPRGSVR